jgi:hypothetical protein
MAALFSSRCRLSSGEECFCTIAELLSVEPVESVYRVATLTVSADTASSTTIADHRLQRESSKLVRRSILPDKTLMACSI